MPLVRVWLVRVAALLLLAQATNLAVMPVALCCRTSAAPAGADSEMACCKKGGPGHTCHMSQKRAAAPASNCALRSGCADPEFAWLSGLSLVGPMPPMIAVAFEAPTAVVDATAPAAIHDRAPAPTTPPPRA